MFSDLISKSVIRDNIQIIIPKNILSTDLLILISHGSGGLGKSEFNVAEFFLKNGYQVGLLDYFSKWNIEKLWWSDLEPFTDKSIESFYKILTDINFPNLNLVHIGFSLGGFLGILNSHKFIKNYCFYPGIVAFTDSIVSKNYDNTTVFIPELDTWCEYSYFETNCKCPPKKIMLPNTYHSFVNKDKDCLIDVNKYFLPKYPITDKEFMNIKPNHTQLTEKYNFVMEKIRLKYNKESFIMCMNLILKDLNEYNNNIT